MCVGGLCSPSTEVCLGPCPALLPGPVHCSSVIFLAVCLFRFCRLKGKHQRECPRPVPIPIPSLRMQVPAHSIYLSKGTLSAPSPRWLQGTEVLAIAVNPLQNCFGEEGELLWVCGGQIPLAGPSWEQQFAVRAASVAQRAEHRAWPSCSPFHKHRFAVVDAAGRARGVWGEECLPPRCVGGGEPPL